MDEAGRRYALCVFDKAIEGTSHRHQAGDLGRVHIREVSTDVPSPFATSLLFGYIAAFMYEGDTPLAERRAQALTLDSALLAELLGTEELRSLLDAEGADQAEGFLARHSGWKAQLPPLPAGAPRGAGWRLSPGADGTDGFFIACFGSPC